MSSITFVTSRGHISRQGCDWVGSIVVFKVVVRLKALPRWWTNLLHGLCSLATNDVLGAIGVHVA